MTQKKMGRPTTNPKNHSVHVRLDDKAFEILMQYCNKYQVSQMEALRRGVYKLEDDLNVAK